MVTFKRKLEQFAHPVLRTQAGLEKAKADLLPEEEMMQQEAKRRKVVALKGMAAATNDARELGMKMLVTPRRLH